MPTKPWREIRREHSKLTKAARAEIDALVRAEIELMRLPALRKARHLSQAAIADALNIAQGDVSKIERRTDVYVRTLRRYVEAAGGTLRIVADFPDSQPIEIDGFADIEAPDSTAGKRGTKRRKPTNSDRRGAA